MSIKNFTKNYFHKCIDLQNTTIVKHHLIFQKKIKFNRTITVFLKFFFYVLIKVCENSFIRNYPGPIKPDKQGFSVSAQI